MTPSAKSGSVLVRVGPEVLAKLKTGGVEPVVILGVTELEDGTYDMTLMTPDVVTENRRLREALLEIAQKAQADRLSAIEAKATYALLVAPHA
jgi:hypothetical protein